MIAPAPLAAQSPPAAGAGTDPTLLIQAAWPWLEPRLDPHRQHVLGRLALCRTPALGGCLLACPDPACGHLRYLCSSCHDRSCTLCSREQRARWEARRRDLALTTRHHHVVLTVPAELRPLLNDDPAALSLLLDAAREAILARGREALHATLGATLVLHTWNRRMGVHFHVHAIVTDGGLTADGRWVNGDASPDGALLRQDLVMAHFRELLLRSLRLALKRGRLAGLIPTAEALERLEQAELRLRWEGRSFRRADLANSRQVFGYLGRYAAGMVIHAGRILEWDPERELVTISLGAKGSGQVLVLSLEDFALRFAQHVLPARFQRIRHAGLYASHPASRARLAAARALLPPEEPAPELVGPGEEPGEARGDGEGEQGLDYWARFGRDYRSCPDCGQRRVAIALSAEALRAVFAGEADLDALLRARVFGPRSPAPVPVPAL